MFDQFKATPKHLADELSLDSENIRIAISEGNVEYMKSALEKGLLLVPECSSFLNNVLL